VMAYQHILYDVGDRIAFIRSGRLSVMVAIRSPTS